MGKYISLGEYNKLYKYIWIYLALKFIITIFRKDFIKIPYSPFIVIQFYYLVFIIIAIIMLIIKNYRKVNENNEDNIERKLIFNKQDIKTEYGVVQTDYFLFINLFFVVILDLVEDIMYLFNVSSFDYWMFEMLFFELINSRFLKTKIYKHHIFSFIFILSSCSLINSLVIIFNFSNEADEVKIFNNRKWFIPVVVIFYLLYHLFKAYTCCNEKYYLEKRVISITNYLLFYGLFGFISSTICAIISSLVPCGDDTIPELSKIICSFKNDKGNYYICNYGLFFKEFTKENLGLRLTIKIFQNILYYACTYFIYVIYKKLSPIYYICSYRFNDLIFSIGYFVYDLVKDNNISVTISVLNILILIFYIIGSIVYLEFIELNFCNLNFYTKRNIIGRSVSESEINLGNDAINSDESSEKNLD